MSIQQITESLINRLPENLFNKNRQSRASNSPSSTFDPAKATNGEGWVNSTSPKSQPSKKTVLIDANSLTHLGDLQKKT